MASSRSATLKMSIAGRSLEAQVQVPEGPARPRQLLPLLQSLTDAIVDISSDLVAQQGKKISCRAGCGACCRQLVPISQAEAYRLADLVEQLPEPRRMEVRRRFADVAQRLGAAGMLQKLCEPNNVPEDALQPIGMDYFRLGIPCPFLEDESCSIHPDRPLACREYLVTSPAEQCQQPSARAIDRVDLPMKVSGALLRLERGRSQGLVPWVPLAIAPQWAHDHPELPPKQTGPELINEVIHQMSGREPLPESTG